MMVWFMHCTTFIVLVAASSAVTEAATVFVEPLKNITAVAGSSTEISCAVLHLQGAPVSFLTFLSEVTQLRIKIQFAFPVIRSPGSTSLLKLQLIISSLLVVIYLLGIREFLPQCLCDLEM